MMNNISKNQYKISNGTVIKGKWHGKSYTILKELGFGANGIVYLAQHQQTHVALKMSDNTISVTSEMNVLKSLAKVQGANSLGPFLMDVDDWEVAGKKLPFYVMEYIQGPDLLTFIQQNGQTWTNILMLQLLSDLEKLHQEGWVFGDLKPENLIVSGPPPRIRCIDVGGTTIQGRSIKEFTEFFDRGYWGLGSRKAEATYDLFAVAMVIINTAYPKRFFKKGNVEEQLGQMISQKKELLKYEKILWKALKGKYVSAHQMRSELLETLTTQEKNSSHSSYSNIKHRTSSTRSRGQSTNKSSNQTRQQNQTQKKGGVLETILIIMVVSLFYVLYILGQLV